MAVRRKKAKKRSSKRKGSRKRAARRTGGRKRSTRRKASRKRPTRRRATRRKSAGKRRPSAAFMAPLRPDAHLAAVVGARPLPRTQVVKKLWNYIRRNGLQDRHNKTMINADSTLRPVFGGKNKVSMFEMIKLVNRRLK